jgi:hypothetical protein
MNDTKIQSLLDWNVRGLTYPHCCSVVDAIVAYTLCHIGCLHDTKLQSVEYFIVTYTGGHNLEGFSQRLPIGTKGGILLRCIDNKFANDHLKMWCSIF